MMNKIFTVVCLCLFASFTLQAQQLIDLDYNPVLHKHNSLKTKANTPFDACIGGLPFINIELQDTIAPSAGNADGTFILDFFTNLDNVDIYVNDVLYGSSDSGSNTFEIENLATGVYNIEAVNADFGLSDNLYLGLSNGSIEGLNENAFADIEEFCDEGGAIIKRFIISTEVIIYDLYDFDGNYLYTFDEGIDTFPAPAGQYYAYYFDRFGDLDEFYLPIEISVETPAPFPFFDDFSDTQIVPNTIRWSDSSAYVNRTMGYAPPSIGVATLDGLDKDGLPYIDSDIQIDGLADKFHSNRFCMDGITPADSLYLSFFYQGRGNGDYPNTYDSLFVEFLNKDGEWIRQWETNFVFDETTPISESSFEQINIAITDSSYFFKGFQFRFANNATLNGFNDHWHIDYVELKDYPDGFEPIFDDITFVYPAPSILNNYSSMPWNQFEGFESKELVSEIQIPVRNNKATPTSINTSAEVIEVCTNEIVNPVEQFGFGTFGEFEEKVMNFTPSNIIPSAPDENVVLDFSFRIEDDGDKIAENNILTHRQYFSNYLSYDDGTPEKAIGYEQNGAQVAQKYFINKPDSLIGLMIYFTHIVDDVSSNEFYLMAWDSINTSNNQALDDIVIARSLSTRNPIYTDGLNQFTIYSYDEPVAVSDSFYVGYQQILSKNLSVGFDVYQPYTIGEQDVEYSKNARVNTYFNDQAVWENSSFEGAVMIRPILASSQNVIATSNNSPIQLNNTLNLYPNPANNFLNIDFETDEIAQLAIYSLDGKLVYEEGNFTGNTINLSNFNTGLYVVTVQTENASYNAKFIKE